VLAIRLGDDDDRHDVVLAIAVRGQHFHRREVQAVVQRELGPQQLVGIEGIVLLVAQVAARQWLLDGVLPDGRLAEPVALAGLEYDGDVRGVGLRIDAHLVAQHARVEITVGGRGAQQPALERLVVSVAETIAALDRAGRW
jgi:hypothetical protein